MTTDHLDIANATRTRSAAAAYDATTKQKAQAKTARIPIKVAAAETLKKPGWIRVKAGSPTTRFYEIKRILREHKLDRQRYPNHSTAQHCANRSFFQGSAVDDWGGCAMFERKHTAAAGWCSAWAKKHG